MLIASSGMMNCIRQSKQIVWSRRRLYKSLKGKLVRGLHGCRNCPLLECGVNLMDLCKDLSRGSYTPPVTLQFSLSGALYVP